jgi:glycosyltransferase involved in cell wall biosynthesis
MTPDVVEREVASTGAPGACAVDPIRILHVIAGLNPGGIETRLMHVVRGMDRRRFQHSFCLYRLSGGPLLADLKELSIPVHKRPVGHGLFGCWRFSREFSKLLRGNSYQVIHCHGTLLPGFFAFLARRAGVPVRVAHAHSAASASPSVASWPYRRLLRHWIWRHATAGLACSSAAGDAVFGPGWGGDARFSVLHCAVDAEPFTREVDGLRLRSEWNLPAGALVIGHVGNFSPVKNYGFLIELACAAIRSDPRFFCLLVGDGVERAAVAEKVRALGIENRVRFAGLRRDVPLLMRAVMDVLVFPSFAEGLPMTLIEAQAAGLPCVVSDAVSRETEVAPGRLNFLPLSAGVSGWLRRVVEVTNEPRLDSAEAMRQLSGTDFVIGQSIHQLADLYSKELA